MITSLHSPHVEAVKALLGSRGNKARRETGNYVIESLQNIRELLTCAPEEVRALYLTEDGRHKLSEIPLGIFDIHDVSPEVMKAMTDTVTPQGLLAVAKIPNRELSTVIAESSPKAKFAYLWQIQDPGNAGTIIRAADAFGFDGVFFSNESVDVYSPKVVRSGAGSHWHLPIVEDVSLEELIAAAQSHSCELFATDASASHDLLEISRDSASKRAIWIFGNEARGIPDNLPATKVSIPIHGKAESLNLATAASVVMYAVSAARK
ncbi:MAG: TrmH family RNA methyltransferase [Actinomycetota bacterium]